MSVWATGHCCGCGWGGNTGSSTTHCFSFQFGEANYVKWDIWYLYLLWKLFNTLNLNTKSCHTYMFENSFISILYRCSPYLVSLWDYWLLIHDLFHNDFEANWENMKILTVCWVWVLRLWNVLRLDNILHFHSLIHSVKFIVWESGKKGNKQTWSKQKRCKKIIQSLDYLTRYQF